jgi:predicted ester cyclase
MRHRVTAMKALVLTAMVLVGCAPLLSAAAQDATPAATDCPVTSEEEVTALARRFAEQRYVNQANFQELLTPAVVYHRSVSTDVITAAEAAQRAAEFKAAFPDVRVTVALVTAKNDIATVVWSAEGTQLGAFDGVAPTGQRATWEGISVLRIACGRVVEVWNQTDALGLREQLGIITDDELSDAEPSEAATPAP